jgi:hypothetical protein
MAVTTHLLTNVVMAGAEAQSPKGVLRVACPFFNVITNEV